MKTAALFAGLVFLAGLGCGRGDAPTSEEERNRAFEAMMANVSLVGQSTMFDREGIAGEEEYVINSVSHLTSDRWLFQTTMKLGSREIPVPVPVTILWAGDTPVITLTDLTIPGLGSYSARVLLFRDSYAGTWMGENGGGHVFGKIVRRE